MVVPDITPEQVRAALDAHEPLVLLDVREDAELAIVRLPGCVHVPLREVAMRAPAELDSQARIVVYCHHGARSRMAAAMLGHLGFSRVENLRGGIDAWSLRIDPSMPRY